MANSTFDGRRFTVTNLGVLHAKPLRIERILLKPNAAGDSITLSSWSESATAKSTKYLISITTTSNTILTDAAAASSFVTANVAALDIIRVLDSETAANIGHTLVLTRDTDQQITTIGKTLTNDTTKIYSWAIWTPTTELVVTCDAATGAKSETEIYFGTPGRWFPNLAVTALSTSATAQIILA